MYDRPVHGPRADCEATGLLVKREIRHRHLTGNTVRPARVPGHVTAVVDLHPKAGGRAEVIVVVGSVE